MTGNPLMDLRRLDQEKRQKKSPSNEEMMKSSNDASNDEMMNSSPEGLPEGSSTPARPSSPLPLRRPSKKGGGARAVEASPPPVSSSPKIAAPISAQATSYEGVKGRVRAPAGKEAVTRLNLDMPEALHDRMRLYCAHRKIKIRELVCALVEDFLAHEDAQEG